MEGSTGARLVIGLFHSSGLAEDAVHRLITEGVAPPDIAHRALKEAGPVPPVLQPELAALEVDPLVICNARQSFARFTRNGEAAVFVRALSDEPAEFASDVLKLYLPLTIEVMPLAERPEAPSLS